MAGGPINGGSITNVIIPTLVQLSTDTLNYFTSMTCLYNPNWSAYDRDESTLPICMFHVKKISTTYANEVSKKRVILFEPNDNRRVVSAELEKQLRQGVMQSISDNIVQQPVTYSLEVIVPFQPLGRYLNSGLAFLAGVVHDIARLAGGEPKATAVINSIFSGALAVADLANQAAQFAGMLPKMNGVSRINMNSLEAMATSSQVLCMKMWTGFDYRYAVITGMSFEKQPLEDDVFRATITLQEMPILNVTRPVDNTRVSIKDFNWAVNATLWTHGSLIMPLAGWLLTESPRWKEKYFQRSPNLPFG